MPKTPDDVKKGLECCMGDPLVWHCDECPYAEDGAEVDDGCDFNGAQVVKDTLALIQQLQAQNAEQADRIQQLETERDAAVAEMPRWNNVADKLPFYNTTVLCIDIDNKHVFIGNMLTCHLYQNKGAMCCAVQGLHGVRYATYWMPLPEPPEESP